MQPFFGSVPPHADWQKRPPLPAHWAELVDVLSAQNPASTAGPALDALRAGAGIVVTGQQVGFFGGPLFTPFKAATALARARQATASGSIRMWPCSGWPPKTTILRRSITLRFPSRRELKKLVYGNAPATPVAGGPRGSG